MFGYRGAHYSAIDHSRHAASQALRNLRTLGADGFTLQGNTETLLVTVGRVLEPALGGALIMSFYKGLGAGAQSTAN